MPTRRERFAEWIVNYRPIPQEIIRHLPFVAGRSFTDISAYRYLYTLSRLEELVELRAGDHLLDVGSFPGGWLSLLDHYFGGSLKLHSLGLSHPPELSERLAAARIPVLPFDIDPANPLARDPNRPFPLPAGRYRVITLLETVEHLYDPLPALRALRAAVQADGLLLLTTDNPFWYGLVWQVLRNRRHPWGPVGESHLFNRGDWRPHIRLYDENDLSTILAATGWRVVAGGAFGDRMGQYEVRRGRWRRRRNGRTWLARVVERLLPRRLAGNHVLVAAVPAAAAAETTVRTG